jgi:hypothetical protein
MGASIPPQTSVAIRVVADKHERQPVVLEEESVMRFASLYVAMSAFALASCATGSSGGGANTGSVTEAAERACVARANSFSNGAGATVERSEFSQANTLVIVRDRNGDRYRCLSSNSGEIAEFSVM